MSNIPNSIEAERAILGMAMLGGASLLAEIADLVSPEDFYREAHQRLYQTMMSMLTQGEPIEMVAVVEKVARLGLAEPVGGIAYVSALPDNAPSTENFEHYARLIRGTKVRRDLLDAARVASEAANDGSIDPSEALEKAGSAILSIDGEGKQAGGWTSAEDAAEEAWGALMAAAESPDSVNGFTTGLVDLDRMLAGLHRTDFVVLAARPAMGKTALALNIAEAAASTGVGVGIFSLEMGTAQLVKRSLSGRARVPASRMRTGHLSRDEVARLGEASQWFSDLSVHIDDTPGLSIVQMRARAKRLKALNPNLGLLVVDYIGLMQGDPKVSRQEQIATASRGMKLIAKELDVCVLCLSQLNRKCEDRNPKIPQLSDLRESGAIEQDADVIMFIYRDEYYNPDTTTKPGVAEVIVAKQRNGPTGTVETAFQGEFTKFSDLARPVDAYDY